MTDFLFDPGTNGFIATPFNLMSTELNSLANATTAVSSVGGSSGVFTQTNFANAVMALIFFVAGGTFTPNVGDALNFWWLDSDNGGSNFDKTVSNTQQPRLPDFTIPLFNAAYASADRGLVLGRRIEVPAASSKLLVYSNTVTLPSTGNLIKAAPFALKY